MYVCVWYVYYVYSWYILVCLGYLSHLPLLALTSCLHAAVFCVDPQTQPNSAPTTLIFLLQLQCWLSSTLTPPLCYSLSFCPSPHLPLTLSFSPCLPHSQCRLMLRCQQLSRYAFCLPPFAICLHALSSRVMCVLKCLCVCWSVCVFISVCACWVCFQAPFILGIDFGGLCCFNSHFGSPVSCSFSPSLSLFPLSLPVHSSSI